MTRQNKKTIWQILFWVNWVVIAICWWNGSGATMLQSVSLFASAVGRLMGLCATYLILLQFFLMGRNPLIEGLWGLDRIIKMHKTTGKLGMLFLISHPLLIVYGYSGFSHLGLWQQFVYLFTQAEDVANATIAFVMFCVIVFISLAFMRSKFRYESWYFVHLFVYIAVLLSFGHQFELGHTLEASTLFNTYWTLLYLIVLGNHILFRFGKPIYKFYKHRFTVTKIVAESPSANSIYIGGKDMQDFRVKPGQFMFFRFLAKGKWWQSHPFSLSRPYDGKEIRITVKALGDFTSALPNIPIGTRVYIDGPYGVFSDNPEIGDKALLIAGGIGITPIRSLFESMLGNNKDVALLYGNRNQSEVVFKNEFEALSNNGKAKVVNVMSDESTFPGERGRIDKEKLDRLVPDWKERDIFLCGPAPMMNGLLALFRQVKIPKSKIHYEEFAL